MKITDIPFVKLLDIQKDDDKLYLNYNKNVKNHIDTIHASAQFALAETQSRLYLQKTFPELVNKSTSILKDSCVKYKKPALDKIFAIAYSHYKEVDDFKKTVDLTGRGTLKVNVEVKDIYGKVTCNAVFNWFILKYI